MTAAIISFRDRQAFTAVELCAEARGAVFTPQTVEAKWTCDRDGNWSLIPHIRFTDPKGARADRPAIITRDGSGQIVSETFIEEL